MRILLAHNYYQRRGGEDLAFENEARLLEDHGHIVIRHAVSNSRIETLTDKARTIGLATWNRGAGLTMDGIIARERPDVLHVHNFFPLLSPAIHATARRHGVPVVQTVHNYRLGCAGGFLQRSGVICEACVGRLPLPAVVHRCYRDSFVGSLAVAGMIAAHHWRQTWHTHVDRFIALTDFARAKLIEIGLPADRISVKPNFVEDRGRPGTGSRSGALFVGRLSVEKGILDLVRSWPGTNTPLAIAGSGPLEADIRRAAGPQVTVLGQQSQAEVAQAYRAAAFLILPSVGYESMPLTLLEAWSAGLPAIAFRHSAFAELIEDGVTGLLVPPGDFAALARAAQWAFEHPDDMAAMGRAGRRRFESRFTAEANYHLLMTIYEEARSAAAAVRVQRAASPAV